ncbi:MAG: endonuclease/exonuclease/phosphatase family protein, partial [Daejeonella sp.]
MRLPAALILSVIQLSMLSCSKRSGDQPAPVAQPPVVLQQAKATSGDTLRVMTFNIHHCNPPSKEAAGTIELNTTASVISKENPDLVALQEVDVNTKRSGFTNQAQLLAQKLGMNVYFGKAINYDGGEYGVAILSKFTLSNSVTHPLPESANPASEDRVLAVSSISFRNGKTIYFGTTHLDVTSAGNAIKLRIKRTGYGKSKFT